MDDLPEAYPDLPCLRPDGLLLVNLLAGAQLNCVGLAGQKQKFGGDQRAACPWQISRFGQFLQRAGFALPVADAGASDGDLSGYVSFNG